MLIETMLKPRHKPERRVICFGTEYVFRALPGHPDRYVADVTNDQAAQALVASGGYREFTDKLKPATLSAAPAPAAVTQPPAVEPPPVAPATAPTTEPPPTETPDTTTDADAEAGEAEEDAAAGDEATDAVVIDRAKTLLSGAARALRATLEKGPSEDLPIEVLKAALVLEQAEQSPRPSVVIALQKAIGA